MRAALVVVAVTACYGPKPQAGAPCAANGACPDGLSCIAGACVLPGTQLDGRGPADTPRTPDAPSADASCVTDTDGDGVPDCSDNCPLVANPGQENEDGDRFGDACDPCPPYPDADPVVDSDGDGVADACDPHPQTPGDTIFLFEGFHGGVPQTWTQGSAGTWLAGGKDDIIGDALATAEATLTIPGPTTKHETVSARLVLIAEAASAMPCFGGNQKLGVVDDYDPAGNTGVVCEVETGKLFLASVNVGGISSAPFTMTVGDDDVVDLRRDTTNFSCRGRTPATSQDMTTIGTSMIDNVPSSIGLRICATKVSARWVMVVANN